jgi:hypothetical protein
MKFYGNANLQKNQLQNPALEVISSFPVNPVVGSLIFKGNTVYICVNVQNYPIWVPLTRDVETHIHIQAESSSSWTITHNLNSDIVSIQIYDQDSKMVIPSEIELTSKTTATVTLSSAMIGRAIVATGSLDGNRAPTE